MNIPIIITVYPGPKEVAVQPGQSLFMALAEAGISIDQACGGNGFCGKCRVKLKNGAPPPRAEEGDFLSPDELAQGMRLACYHKPSRCEVVELIQAGKGKSQKTHLDAGHFFVDPWQQPAPDDRVMAVDFGTTNLVGHLLDPFTGVVLHSESRANSQAIFGADVMSRLAYASSGGRVARRRLQDLAMADLEALAAGFNTAQHPIRHLVAAMNTAMASCLLNWDPDRLGRHPCEAEDNGAIHREAFFTKGPLLGTQLHLPPVIGGYVGSDTVAAILAIRALDFEPPYLVLDIGTNAEVALVNDNGIAACSCAAGPAFEGGGIRRGMRAVEGAIDRVLLNGGTPEISVIGESEALGITGSGLFSFIGEMIRVKALDHFGAINTGNLAAGIVSQNHNGRQVRLTPRVNVSENDIQQFMLAKAATRAGVEVLLQENNISPDALTKVVLCGTFAKHLAVEDVLAIGLIPPVSPTKIHLNGNAAAQGAAMMACSIGKFKLAEKLASQTHHYGLSGNPAFKKEYEKQVCFPKYVKQ